MAQLLKIQDYISRYQIDLARYPTQFIRLKQNQWERVKHQWQTGEVIEQWEHLEGDEIQEDKKPSIFQKFFPFKKEKEEIIEEFEDIEQVKISNDWAIEESIPEEDTTLFFEPNMVYAPKTMEELKKMFIDQFFHFQMKWASSTLRERSYVDPKYMRDPFLRAILQTLPDNYLVFYFPIIRVKKAPIELDIMIMTPTDCLCITVLEQEDQAVYIANSDRFWVKKVGKAEKKVLSPLIQLNRMEKVIEQLFVQNGIEMPIRKILLTRNGYIDYPGNMYGVQFVDKRKFPEWMQQLKHSVSPMKHMQIRAAQAVLSNVQTTSFHRDIWNTDTAKKED
ncbi:NERD domain-containing protein [Lysinibacillus sp. 2017]|uniref:nuclease-related domain-containing protein n=1 Tax=unclassified Lysinibacillus TaxID=2636778 RepID=UPI000D52A05E|nr:MULTISPECIES: nuclease-related domain-containing protein [unclassified Lysinibacillus]AWE08375.1 NERD domain-containing protein [Lysinibacillus sp. 2017]TGN35776.1 NERD domain-containing protein [Lysinibacillus sp. S2017]